MIHSIKSTLSRNLKNVQGWRTNRKIVVIESDDWGSIRMPNKEVYYKLFNKGIRVDLCPYNKYDTLANVQDFDALFNLLEKHTDFKNNHPIITFNTNVANPDFDRIKEGNFENYYLQKFPDTLKEYYPNEDVFSMWQNGINSRFLYPQFHGREHLNSDIWLSLIRNGNTDLKEAFNSKLFGLSFATSNQIQVPFLASLIYNSDKEKNNVIDSLIEGTKIFKDIFSFSSKSFIAPLYAWSSELESHLLDAGIMYIQGTNRHTFYDFDNKKFNRDPQVMGRTNKLGQIYLHRNCTFEPTILSKIDNVGNCLKHIESAFFWKKPAVISMHRLNFIGGLEESNRTRNLEEFDELLRKISQKWKNVEFMHSSELGELIQSQKTNAS